MHSIATLLMIIMTGLRAAIAAHDPRQPSIPQPHGHPGHRPPPSPPSPTCNPSTSPAPRSPTSPPSPPCPTSCISNSAMLPEGFEAALPRRAEIEIIRRGQRPYPRSQTRRNTTFSPPPVASRPSTASCRAPLATSARKIRFNPGRRCPRRGTVTCNPAARIFFMASSCISAQPCASPGTPGPNGPLACRQVAVRNHRSALPSPLNRANHRIGIAAPPPSTPNLAKALPAAPHPPSPPHTSRRNYF